MDPLSVATNCGRCYLALPPPSWTFNCIVVERFAKSELIRTLPHANKSVTPRYSTRILIYIDNSFSRTQTVAKPLLSYLLPFSLTFTVLVVNDWIHQRVERIDRNCLSLTNVVLQGSTRILIYIDGLLQSHQTVQAVAILPSSIFPNVQNALVKRLAGSPKGVELILPHANKVLLRSTRILIYMDTSFNRTKLCKPLLSYLLPFSRTFNCY
jgi:hypothetical protein